MRQVTIKDIAQQAGVSIGTVDRVLHNRYGVADTTRSRVLNIAASLQYQPNLLARALAAKKHYRLSALLPKGGPENQFWDAHPAGLEKAMAELKPYGVELTISYFPLHDGLSFSKAAEKLIRQKPDGVLLAPVLKKEATKLCAMLDEQTVPYVFVDTLLEHTQYIAFAGEDASRSGKTAAHLAHYGLFQGGFPRKWDVLAVHMAKSLENTHHLNTRFKGFTDYFNKLNGRRKIRVIPLEIPSLDSRTINRLLGKTLIKYPTISIIWVSGAKTHLAARYLEENMIKGIRLIGYELTGQNSQFLSRGTISFLLAQNPAAQASTALKRLFGHLSGEPVISRHDIQPVSIVSRWNMNEVSL